MADNQNMAAMSIAPASPPPSSSSSSGRRHRRHHPRQQNPATRTTKRSFDIRMIGTHSGPPRHGVRAEKAGRSLPVADRAESSNAQPPSVQQRGGQEHGAAGREDIAKKPRIDDPAAVVKQQQAAAVVQLPAAVADPLPAVVANPLPIAAVDQEPPMAVVEEPPMAVVDEAPMVVVEEMPMAAVEEPPIAAVEEAPMADDEEAPIANVEEAPIANVNEQAVAAVKEEPAADDDDVVPIPNGPADLPDHHWLTPTQVAQWQMMVEGHAGMLKASVRWAAISRSHIGYKSGIWADMSAAEILTRINMFIAQVPTGAQLTPPSEELLEAAAGDGKYDETFLLTGLQALNAKRGHKQSFRRAVLLNQLSDTYRLELFQFY